jgi:type II secretory pathway pseudopilin PulG
MTTLILVMCFSAVVLVLLTIILIRSQSTSDEKQEKREERVFQMIGSQQQAMETLIRQSSTTAQTLSADMTETMRQALADQNETVKDLFLGREQDRSMFPAPESDETEREPTPGIETFDGLPKNMVEALRREDQETEQWTSPEWTVVSAPQPNGSGPISESPWTLDPQ